MQKVSLLLSVLCLAVSCGYLTGRLIAVPAPDITYAPDVRPLVPVVRVEGIRNGLLYGSITGNVRLQIADVVLVQSGTFVTDASALLRNEVWVTVPQSAKYVASKRGKKYYDISSAAGERIVPSNRVYFTTVQDAESAGYTD